MLSRAISSCESRNAEMVAFETRSSVEAPDLATLRLFMDQHDLKVNP